MMPGMDGYEVTRRLKAGNETKAIPIILITALGIITAYEIYIKRFLVFKLVGILCAGPF